MIAKKRRLCVPLPKEIDERILERFERLIEDGEALLRGIDQARSAEYERRTREIGFGVIDFRPVYAGPNAIDYGSFLTRVKNLARNILDTTQHGLFLKEIQDIERENKPDISSQLIFGKLKGLKDDYESGMLDDLSLRIEANVNSDYLGQAKQLLRDEELEYIDAAAAVIAGAVLEKALRSLCNRQEPPIPTEKSNGKRKTLGTLIDDLSKVSVFNQPVATRLLSYAQTRNAAAHGEFDKFTRQDVESMIPGINDFLADYQ